MKFGAPTSINWINYKLYRCIVLLLCICLHCVTSDNGNETNIATTAIPLYNATAMQENAHEIIENNISTTATTTILIENLAETVTEPISSSSLLPLSSSTGTTTITWNDIKTKSNSTILSVVVPVSTTDDDDVVDVSQAARQEHITKLLQQQTEITLTESTILTSTSTVTSTSTQAPTTAATTTTTTQAPPVTETAPTTTTKAVTEPVFEDSCLKSHIVKLLPEETEFDSQFYVNVTKGDIIVTVISRRLTSAQFIVNRINELKLIRDNVTIGIRSIIIVNNTILRDVLEREVQYLKDCVAYPVGIFVSQDLWHLVKPVYKTINYNIWSYPTLERLKYATIAKLFAELPWSQKNISVEIVAPANEMGSPLKADFVAVSATEKMCFVDDDDEEDMSLQSNNTSHLRILLGDRAMAETANSIKKISKKTVTVGISFKPDRDFVPNLPQSSYFIAETEIDLHTYTMKNAEKPEGNYPVLPSDFMVLGSMMLEITEWLNDSINSNCLRRNRNAGIGACSTFTQDTPQITYAYLGALPDLARTLKMPNITKSLNIEMIEKKVVEMHEGGTVTELKPVAVVNLVTNATMIYRKPAKHRNGTLLNNQKLGQFLSCSLVRIKKPKPTNPIEGYEAEFLKMFWRIKPESWVAAGLTTSCLGIVLCVTILTFLFSRICIQDVLEGNPMCTVLLLFALILQFASFIPFSVEYTGYHQDMANSEEAFDKWNTHCSVKIFVVSLTYCLTFSLLLCRAVMLASIGSEGGFLSHVNGYIQSLICFFSTLVQVGLSTQLVVLMNTINKDMTCNDIYYGHWFWGIVGYDGFLLLMLVLLSPFVIKSQRNYKEGLLLVVGSILCLIVWCIWVPICLMNIHSREAAIPLGAQATALAILGGILLPRSILIVKSIARSDLVQALPSLTSLAFAQAANQYASEQSMYDCVNPAMRNHLTRDEHQFADSDLEDHPSPSQVPTLPLRTSRNFGNINNYYRHQNGHTNLEFNDDSLRLNLPPSPDKMTRF